MLDDALETTQQLSASAAPSESLGKRIIAYSFTLGAIGVALYAVVVYGVLVDTVVGLGNSAHPLMKLAFAQVRAAITGSLSHDQRTPAVTTVVRPCSGLSLRCLVLIHV